MKYVSVSQPGSEMTDPIFNYFDDYLVSMGEPLTNINWISTQIENHIEKILKEKPENTRLFIDSGGFQIIMGYLDEYGKFGEYLKSRVPDYIRTYHNTLEKYYENIDLIFGLDIFNSKYEPDMIEYLNYESVQKSIDLIKKYPVIADKQLFVMQTSNMNSFRTWKKMLLELEVYKYYTKWSFGGLVGLKKATNAKFSHAVPATLWLLTYQKKYNFKIEHIHWLGQSSRLSFLAMGLFEKLYNLNMTSDSSQLVRFAPIEAKLPYLMESNGEFELIKNREDILKMFDNHSIPDRKINGIKRLNGSFQLVNSNTVTPIRDDNSNYFEYTEENFANGKTCDYFYMTPKQYYIKNKNLDNATFIEFQCQNLSADLKFGDLISTMIVEAGIDTITEKQLKELHPILCNGRVAKELMNNIEFFRKFKDVVSTGNAAEADKIMEDVLTSYIK